MVPRCSLPSNALIGGGDDSCLEVLEFVSPQFESHPLGAKVGIAIADLPFERPKKSRRAPPFLCLLTRLQKTGLVGQHDHVAVSQRVVEATHQAIVDEHGCSAI